MSDESNYTASTSLWASLINTGSKYDLPVYLQRRVRPTNILCLLVIFVLSIPFVTISLIYFPGMAIFPAGGGLVSILVMIINARGGIYYSRIILPILLLILSSLYNAYFSTSISDSITSVYMVELSFIIIPFIIFDLKEHRFLIISAVFSFFIILVFPLTWSKFDMGYDGTVLREGWLAVVTIALATFTQLGAILGLAFLNRQMEQESNQARQQAEERNEKLLTQQEENIRKTEELELAQAEEKKRQWAAEGVAQVSEILRKTDNGSNIFDQLVASLVKYLKANQAGLFVVERESEQECTIDLKACYAYERKKFISKTIQPGEGLIGQAFLEADYLYVTDIPQDYVRITSGLGKATPTSLLIVPLKVNDVVEGVLEMAGFYPFEEHEIDFLKKAGEIIASHVQNQRVMQQTRHLLQSAQEQSEEMRAQEEEMRQNMEELQATQEEMHRKEREYQVRIEALEDQISQKETHS
uniref:GAF domain-containing protein n=1 Tax=Roseihalotalea indica TaxID=2867963 RepID=A0AA49GKM0_9BACT|nr:GAF domain-containing protein [Tunicatimonas sp. TK19036]